MNILDEKLLTQIRFLKKYLNLLKDMAQKSKKEYLEDFIYKGAVERYLQLAIECCINIGNRIISLEQFKYDLTPPETYAEVFEKLQKIGLIEENLSTKLKTMTQFRNKLVHVYWEIDDAVVYDILQNNLKDIEEFLKIAIKYVQSEGK
ncbi:type VII toxin-antitoxin system HepT family RNase toxin [Carboxydothermus hydrogenoformans]|uniref:type VII toxin-antitoxin system HepT family RNase toxin n=1 Tax=Carboxydothermus hydrogenoformans TaxID=129958 RepID=UPI003B830009